MHLTSERSRLVRSELQGDLHFSLLKEEGKSCQVDMA